MVVVAVTTAAFRIVHHGTNRRTRSSRPRQSAVPLLNTTAFSLSFFLLHLSLIPPREVVVDGARAEGTLPSPSPSFTRPRITASRRWRREEAPGGADYSRETVKEKKDERERTQKKKKHKRTPTHTEREKKKSDTERGREGACTRASEQTNIQNTTKRSLGAKEEAATQNSKKKPTSSTTPPRSTPPCPHRDELSQEEEKKKQHGADGDEGSGLAHQCDIHVQHEEATWRFLRSRTRGRLRRASHSSSGRRESAATAGRLGGGGGTGMGRCDRWSTDSRVREGRWGGRRLGSR
jgi:hypothetical protein